MIVVGVLAVLSAGPASASPGPDAGLIVVADDAAAQAAIASLDRQVNVREAEQLAPSDDISTVTVAAADTAEALALLNADPRVEYAEPNHPVYAVATPSDPKYSAQWQPVKVGADLVWDTTTGQASTVIAVIDTGVNVAHPDFSGATFVPGRDFVNGDNDPADDNGHGTGVAGVIAAQHNTLGGAGICPRCAVMPIKALDAVGSGSYANVIAAIDFAVAQGADIINLSLAGTATSATLESAVLRAHAAGILVVAAAGNYSSKTPDRPLTEKNYPAAYEPAVAVAASLATDERSTYSHYGADWVDVAAPGCNVTLTRTGYNDNFCGTSSAAPVVAGMAGLLRPAVAQASLLSSTLRRTADPVPESYVANGRIDGLAALGEVDVNSPSVSITSPAAGWMRGDVPAKADASDDFGVRKVEFLVDEQVVSTSTAAPYTGQLGGTVAEGDRVLRARATDTAGRTTTSAPVALRIDNTAPEVAIVSPDAAAVLTGPGTVSVSAADSASGVKAVAFFIDGALVATDTSSPYEAALPTTLVNGVHTLRVDAADVAGNTGTQQQSFTVDNPPPPSGGGGGGGGGGGALPPPPTEEPTPGPTEPTSTSEDGTVKGDVAAGGRVTTDGDGAGPTSTAPLQVGVTSPVAGSVSITRDNTVGVPAGYSVVGLQATITAPTATAAEPLELLFDVHGSALPEGRDDDALVLFRNGRAVPGCTNDDGSATPDPCVASVATDGEVISIRVLTSRASTWALGVAAVACPTAPSAGFDDVGANAHAAAIDCAVARQVVGGLDGDTYAPREAVTRAQMASFIANAIRSAGARLPAGSDAFADDDASVHESAINGLANAGIVGGVARGQYDPRSRVTREQMATFLVRAHDYVAAQDLAVGPDAFGDDDGRAHESNINKAAAAGLASGLAAGEFGPAEQVRRDQLASFVVRLLDRLVASGDAD